MKNVLIYNKVGEKTRHSDDLLDRYLKAQVHNSLDLGWKPEDIIIGTNFDFEHMGVKNVKLEIVFMSNCYMNKWLGMLEMMESEVLDEDFWFHDQDNWQTEMFDFPSFAGEIGGCEYRGTTEWNTACIYVKKTSIDIIRYIMEAAEQNKPYLSGENIGDEHFIAALRKFPEVQDYFMSLNTQYNVGCTWFDLRYGWADKPVYVFGLNPHKPRDWEIMEDYIDKRLKNIFDEYKLFDEVVDV